MAQWKRIQQGTMRFRVPFVASFSGLRTQRCRELWCSSQKQLGSGVAVAGGGGPAAAAPTCHLAWDPHKPNGAAMKKQQQKMKK